MGVAEDQGAPGADEVQVLVAVGVPDAGALAAGDEGRLATHGAKGADGAVHAAGHEPLGAGEEGLGAGSRFGHWAVACASIIDGGQLKIAQPYS